MPSDKASIAANRRTKTARACDSCRRKKIRCDVIDDGKVLADPNNGNGGLTCAHCRQYGFECTFFLPITETRFKKKREREAEEMAAAAVASRSHMGMGILPPMLRHHERNTSSGSFLPSHFVSTATRDGILARSSNTPPTGHPLTMHSLGASAPPSLAPSFSKTAHLDVPPVRISSTQEWPRPHNDSPNGHPSSSRSTLHSLQSQKTYSSSPHSSSEWRRQGAAGPAAVNGETDSPSDTPSPPDTRVLGPTSIAYIVHSTAFVPGAAIEEHDLKHHQTFEVGASGDGIIKFHKPPARNASTSKTPNNHDDEDEAEESSEEVMRVSDSLRGRLAGDVAEKLVNTYFERLGYLFPVVTKSEFLHMSAPPPLMLYAICSVAALSREVPREVLSSIKITLNGLFRDNDIFSMSHINNVKALLILSLHSDVHGSSAVQAGSRCWNRVGAAIRMSQDLGMHRDASGRDDLDDDAFFLEQKRRIWGCCVTADRCISISLGHPLAIDLTDCDVRLPAPHEILRYPTDLPSVPGLDRPFAFNAEMLKLSILFGRVMKTIYSPTGLMKTTDEEIVGLLNDIDRWKENLPVALQWRGAKESPASVGILHVSYVCLVHLFFRVFMRISYSCPQHLTFALTIERMTDLIKISREAIDWVDVNDFYLDTIQFVSYGLVFCTTVQYHAWIRRKDAEALSSLKRAADCVNRFRRPGEVEAHADLSMRAKTAEVITLLHNSAMGVYKNSPNSGNLNPTAGVTNRRWTDTVGGIVFKPDQTRPGGGVYVATKHNLMLDDMPQGSMIFQETDQGAVPALVRTNQDSWRAIGDVNMEQLNGSTGLEVPNNLTHLAGSVWTDAEGRPVDRQGARLLTMIPVPGGDAMIQSYPGGPRLSFSSIAGGIVPPGRAEDPASVAAAATAAAQGGGVNALPAQASDLQNNNWLNALAAQAAISPSGIAKDVSKTDGSINEDLTIGATQGGAPTFNFSDLYTFDGQIAQPASMIQNSSNSSTQQRLMNLDSSANGELTPKASDPNQAALTPSTTMFSLAGAEPTSASGQRSTADPLSLDGMPEQLDFNAWASWFQNVAPSSTATPAISGS